MTPPTMEVRHRNPNEGMLTPTDHWPSRSQSDERWVPFEVVRLINKPAYTSFTEGARPKRTLTLKSGSLVKLT